MDSSEAQANLFYVLIAIVVILITFLITRKLKKATNVVLLVGLSDSGKTALFSKLVFNKPKKSVKSLKENEAQLNDFNLKLVDIPGAERLRSRYWDQYRQTARRVIFVLDSTTIKASLSDCSEYLYSLLSDKILSSNNVDFTIACNKQDIDGALSASEVRTVLEEELTAIKETKRGQLGKTSEVENEDYLADKFKGRISLDVLKVQMIETSMHNLDQLIKIII